MTSKFLNSTQSNGWKDLGAQHAVAWGEPALMKGAKGQKFLLELSLNYEIVHVPDDQVRGPFKVSTLGYMHSIQTTDGKEIISYHWHPFGREPGQRAKVTDPHLHIDSSQLRPDGVLKTKHHILTARTPVEGIVRFCIDQLEVAPLRDNWRDVLARTESKFHKYASWVGLLAPEVRDIR